MIRTTRKRVRAVVESLRSIIPRSNGHRKAIICHQGHENDLCFIENISEFLSAHHVDHGTLHLRAPQAEGELRRCLRHGPSLSLIGFNSQLDHAWIEDEPVVRLAARRGVPVVQWIFDHPSSRWPEFNCSTRNTSRFLFHSAYSQAYFDRYCCAGAVTATAGSVGPNRRSRSTTDGIEAYSQRPVACLIALGLARLGRRADETEVEIGSLDAALAQPLRNAIARARFELDRPLEIHLVAALEGADLDDQTFNRCFRLLNDSVQHHRRTEIMQVAARFGVTIQSDESARAMLSGQSAQFRANVSMADTLASMPRCRAVLSVCPVNDSIHDRTCNALNAGCLPILEDNRAHRGVFSHGENALLFRYGDGSLAECLALACGAPEAIYPIAERAKAMRDQPRFRFGAFGNMLTLAGFDVGAGSP